MEHHQDHHKPSTISSILWLIMKAGSLKPQDLQPSQNANTVSNALTATTNHGSGQAPYRGRGRGYGGGRGIGRRGRRGGSGRRGGGKPDRDTSSVKMPSPGVTPWLCKKNHRVQDRYMKKSLEEESGIAINSNRNGD
ncbi:MAG: hypothetical protein M1839_003970 [Geoglossum umbratile]|nr:MAG: hypothetical protein M1839_003970 [Geoglossum umbratile]